MKPRIQSILDELLTRHPELSVCRDDIIDAYRILTTCHERGGKILICGNGGSASDAEHIVGELMKSFLLPRKINPFFAEKLAAMYEDGRQLADALQAGVPAIALSAHASLMTAISNDISADMVYAQQVYVYARPGDVFIGLSTSGNAKNVVNAAKIAASCGLPRIGITGSDGGPLASVCTCPIRLPETETWKIQELTLPVYHALCAMVEAHFFNA